MKAPLIEDDDDAWGVAHALERALRHNKGPMHMRGMLKKTRLYANALANWASKELRKDVEHGDTDAQPADNSRASAFKQVR